jgi:hypothetical protein
MTEVALFDTGPSTQDDNGWFAGTQQSYRMFNKKRSLIPEIWGLKGATNETWLFWHYGSAMYVKSATAAGACTRPPVSST